MIHSGKETPNSSLLGHAWSESHDLKSDPTAVKSHCQGRQEKLLIFCCTQISILMTPLSFYQVQFPFLEDSDAHFLRVHSKVHRVFHLRSLPGILCSTEQNRV
jgi:hypothetical protein